MNNNSGERNGDFMTLSTAMILSITTWTPCLPMWSHQLGGLRDWLGGDRMIWSLVSMWSPIATRKTSGSSGSIPLSCYMIAAASHWWALPIFYRTLGQLGPFPLWLRKQGGWMCHARSLELSDCMLFASPFYVSCIYTSGSIAVSVLARILK